MNERLFRLWNNAQEWFRPDGVILVDGMDRRHVEEVRLFAILSRSPQILGIAKVIG